ncbi:MAG: efflux RND transporter periplasmic adaptor subunit [Cyanobacteria bacterium J06627_8]
MTQDVSSQSESNGYSQHVASHESDSSSPSLDTDPSLETQDELLDVLRSSSENQSPSGWFSGKVGLAIGLAAGLAIGVIGLGQRPAPSSTSAEGEAIVETTAPAQTVTVSPVEVRQVSRTLEATGTVNAFDLLPILPKATGLQIQQVLVDEGDTVTAGQVMAVLDRSVLEAQLTEARADLQAVRARVEQQEAALAQAEARLREAQANLERFESLSSAGAVSSQEFDTRSTAEATAREDVRVAEANVRSAQADVRSQDARIQQLQTQLEQTLVKAPADGLVAERVARVGNVTSSSAMLFSIIRDRLLELQVNIPETQLPDIRVGTSVIITSDADERIQVQGQVREISPLIDSDTREAIVSIDLPPSNVLRPGMFLRASITTSSSNGLTVPAKAVIPQSNGEALVYRVVDGDRVEVVTVILGEVLDSSDPSRARIEIQQGLNNGDRVVVDGAGYLNDGDAIAIVQNLGRL